MKNILTLLLLVALSGFSCNSTLHKVFGNKTPHEQYEEKLDDTGLESTPEGRAWLAVSKKAVETPQTISLPYRHQGFFDSDKPRALGLRFTARAGEKLSFQITKKSGTPFVLYADLFKGSGAAATHLLAADTASSTFSFDIEEGGIYVLRLQPELYRNAEYTIGISVGPSLNFPIQGNKGSVGSIWGDDRDGGNAGTKALIFLRPN